LVIGKIGLSTDTHASYDDFTQAIYGDSANGRLHNYEPIKPFDGADRLVPAGGDDYTLLLRDGGKVTRPTATGSISTPPLPASRSVTMTTSI
jgi:hypothetical protein